MQESEIYCEACMDFHKPPECEEVQELTADDLYWMACDREFEIVGER